MSDRRHGDSFVGYAASGPRLRVVNGSGNRNGNGRRFSNGAAAPSSFRPAETLRLSALLASSDPELATHGRLVGHYASMTARELGLPRQAVQRLRLAGALHDIGKLAMPVHVLEKPGPLTESEWAQIKAHPTIGANMLRTAGLDEIADWVLAHHERPDGTGYPCGIGAGEIPIEAAILAVADAYHAMTTDRPYQAAIEPPLAFEELRQGAGSQFETLVVEAFLPVIERNPLTASHW